MPANRRNHIAWTGDSDAVYSHVTWRRALRAKVHFYSMTAHARGALHLEPRARAVLDIGALHARAELREQQGEERRHRGDGRDQGRRAGVAGGLAHRRRQVEHAGVEPDLLCLAKGLTCGTLPLAATLATADIYAAFLDPDPRRAFLHGHSFTANPIACAAALASLDVWRDEPVGQRLGAIEAVHAARLPALADLPAVAAVRWLGTVGIVELHETGGYFAAGLGRRVAAAMLERGVLLRPLGPVLYLMPPYCVTTAELDAVYDSLANVLATARPA